MSDLFGKLGKPFTGELLFDYLPDIVYFVKNSKGQYEAINDTVVERSGLASKSDIIGKTPCEVLGKTLGQFFEEQDQEVIKNGLPLLNQLELHAYRSGEPGWCLTTKLPLRDDHDEIIGLVGISRDLKNPNLSSDEYARLVVAIEYAESNLSLAVKIKDIAKAANMSPFQFDRCIQRVFGLTAGQWVLKLRIGSAERQLVTTEVAIVDIALNVGYSDQSTFTRQFHKTTGMSPSSYRNQAQNAARSE
ncbi:AraC family transcriptional regulator [Arenicella sp. 4NH20-0111]|uniref:AraC family transcriptional regulator n=1 Tax=Arenicella sp. 4NH20-0111 TaxID=3127648 RepID=UPI003104E202